MQIILANKTNRILAPFLLLSLLVHIALLMIIRPQTKISYASSPHSFQVYLSAPVTLKKINVLKNGILIKSSNNMLKPTTRSQPDILAPSPPVRREKIHLKINNALPIPTKQKVFNDIKIPELISVKTNESLDHFDMAHLLSQAREYAKKEYKNSEATSTYGDYYCTFNGSVNGSFYFHLDSDGQIIGSGQSDAGDLSFKIKGSVTSNGSFSATGFNKDGTGGLMGKLDIKTGKVYGTWSARIWNGTFSGQHE